MNLKGGWAMIRVNLFGYLSERGFFWTLALGWMTGPVIYLLVWTAASEGGAIGGYERNDFILYYLAMILVNQFTYPTAHWAIAEHIQGGSISSALLRPIPLVYSAMGVDAATKMVCVPFVGVIIILLGLFFRVQVALSGTALALAALALLLAQAMRFLLAYILSLTAFWTQRSDAILSINDTFVFLFAGQVAPLAVFPGALRALAEWMPYRYVLSFPLEVMLGKLSIEQTLFGFAAQIAWLAVLLLLHAFVYRSGIKKYSAVGG